MDFTSAVKAVVEGKCKGIRSDNMSQDVYLRFPSKDDNRLYWNKTGYTYAFDPNDMFRDWELVPKPKVIKRIEGWVNVYPNRLDSDVPGFVAGIYTSPEEARECGVGILGEPLYIKHEYEETED